MNILLVSDNPESQAETLNALQLAFGDEAAVETAVSFSAARQKLQSGAYHIVLDLGLSTESRWRLLRLAWQFNPLVQVIMVFESNQEDQVADALRRGASEALVRSSSYPATLPFIAERAYERYALLEQRRQTSRQAFDLEALGEFTQAVAQAMDLAKAMDQARTALHEIDILLEKSREELVKRRTMLREAGSEVQRRERGLTALSDLAEAVSCSPDAESILSNILNQALAMTAAEAGAVLVIEDESKPLRLAAQVRLPDTWIAALSGRWPDVSSLMTSLVSGKILLVQDVTHSDAAPELLTLLSQEGFTSMIGVPLQVGGNLLGGLIVATRHTEKLTERDARWLGVMGQQASIAIENARLRADVWAAAENWFRESPTLLPSSEFPEESPVEIERLTQALDEARHQLRRREEALSAIINVIGTASYRPDVSLIMRETLPYILEQSEAGGIWILDEALEILTLAAHAGLTEELVRPWPQEEWRQDNLLAAVMSGELVYLDDPSSQRGVGMTGQLKAAGARAIVAIPLQIQGQSVGAMIIMAREHSELQAHDAELLTAVSQQLSQALERQKLQADIHRLALELTSLQERSEDGNPPLEMLAALQQMAEQVQRREAQFTIVCRLSRMLAEDREQVLKAGLTGASDALRASAGLILRRNLSQDYFTLVYQNGLPGVFVDKWALRPIETQESLPPEPLQDLHIITRTTDSIDQPALIADLFLFDDDTHTIVVTPLSLQWQTDGLLGILMLAFSTSDPNWDEESESPLSLTKSDFQWLGLLAQTMTLSIAPTHQLAAPDETKDSQPKGLGEETDLHSREQTVLLELAQLLSPMLEADKLLEKATEEIARLTDMDACWVMLLESIREGEGEELVMHAPHGLSQDFTRHLGRSTTDKGLHGEVITSGQAIFLIDLSQASEGLSIAWEMESLYAFAGLPLKAEGQCFGLLAIAHHSVRDFSPSDQQLFTAIAQQLSVVLRNAQRFAQMQQTAHQQEKGNRVLREINNQLMERLAELEKHLDALEATEPAS